MRRYTALYRAQFNRPVFIENPGIEFFKFSFLLAVSVYALLHIEVKALRDIALFVGGASILMLLFILVFNVKRI